MLGRRKRVVEEVELGPPTVLVVNDDEGAIELLARLLQTADYEVEKALTYDEALVKLAAVQPDCVVLDLSAGGIGENLKLLDSIRGHIEEKVATTRVVLVTHQASNRMFSWQAGIDAFLLRPFHGDELLQHVDAVLTRPDEERARHRRRELDAAQSEGRTIDVRAWETKRF